MPRVAIIGLIFTAALGLSGCGNGERALKLPEVETSLEAAGLRHLDVAATKNAFWKARKKGLNVSSGPAPDGPDYLSDRGTPGLLIVRFGSVRRAAHAVPTVKVERSGAMSVRANRACNVVVLDYRPQQASLRAAAGQALAEIRRRCN